MKKLSIASLACLLAMSYLAPAQAATSCLDSVSPAELQSILAFNSEFKSHNSPHPEDRLPTLSQAGRQALYAITVAEKYVGNYKNLAGPQEISAFCQEAEDAENSGHFEESLREELRVQPKPTQTLAQAADDTALVNALKNEPFNSQLIDASIAWIKRHQGDAKFNHERLSDINWLALMFYTSEAYGKVNSPLNKGLEVTPNLKTLIDRLNEVLSTLPDYRGEVTRFASLPPPVKEAHVPGKTVWYPAFTSTSKKKNFFYPGAQKFKIFSLHGKDITDLSAHAEEEEILFSSHTQFKVMAIFPVVETEVCSPHCGPPVYVLREVE